MLRKGTTAGVEKSLSWQTVEVVTEQPEARKSEIVSEKKSSRVSMYSEWKTIRTIYKYEKVAKESEENREKKTKSLKRIAKA